MRINEEKLVEETLHLPHREAARWRHTPHELEDLIADGYVGLAKAARRYDPSLGVPFIAFATPYVRGAITDSVRARARRRQLGDGTFVDVVGFADVRHDDDGRTDPYEPPDPGPTPHDTLVSLDKLRVIGTLPEGERLALVRTIVEGDTAADVAEDLGVSPARVYALVHTGSARLRKRAA
jgi:RNA polymerase primary sigma factor